MTKPMTSEELTKILERHRLYLDGDPDGVRADLRGANLSQADLSLEALNMANLNEADLSSANLGFANLSDASLIGADLSGANLGGADLSRANLSFANLSGADLRFAALNRTYLRFADLRGANLDYSVLPLWCGSLNANFDDRQLKQIAYHLVKAGLQSKNASPETKAELRKIIDFANEFHRVDECGIIVEEEGKETEE